MGVSFKYAVSYVSRPCILESYVFFNCESPLQNSLLLTVNIYFNMPTNDAFGMGLFL